MIIYFSIYSRREASYVVDLEAAEAKENDLLLKLDILFNTFN